jgi:hypothetical protein
MVIPLGAAVPDSSVIYSFMFLPRVGRPTAGPAARLFGDAFWFTAARRRQTVTVGSPGHPRASPGTGRGETRVLVARAPAVAEARSFLASVTPASAVAAEHVA